MEQELEMVRAPGFRFYPTEEELITFYLKHKIQYSACKNRLLQDRIHRVIPQLHVYDFYPWDLPQYAGEVCRGDQEQWFFFIPRQEKELQGSRPSRLTSCGYWKGTGSPSVVYSSSSPNNQAIGIKRSMVFYKGRAPTGNKTKWKMNEYKAFHHQQQQNSSLSSNMNLKPKLMQEVSLCRVYIKSNCARAFDRRPSGSVARDHRLLGPARHTFNENHATTSPHFNRKSITKSTTSTFDYNSDSLDVFEDQALWNWEENH